ncbi:MAG: hypothetical protein NDI88_12275, partial [Lysobacter sp.]|nr:hypothetical protein [Lysobacter sp.]
MTFFRSQALLFSIALALLAPAVHAGPATQLVLTVPGSATAGAPISIILEAKDSSGLPDPTYTGTVTFTTNDQLGSVPNPYTFTGADAGVKTFASGVTFRTAGPHTLTAFSNAIPPLTVTSSTITVTGGAAASLTVNAPSTASNGLAFDVTVTAKDVYGNTSPGYAGTVQLTSTDGAATLPTATALNGGSKV